VPPANRVGVLGDAIGGRRPVVRYGGWSVESTRVSCRDGWLWVSWRCRL